MGYKTIKEEIEEKVPEIGLEKEAEEMKRRKDRKKRTGKAGRKEAHEVWQSVAEYSVWQNKTRDREEWPKNGQKKRRASETAQRRTTAKSRTKWAE